MNYTVFVNNYSGSGQLGFSLPIPVWNSGVTIPSSIGGILNGGTTTTTTSTNSDHKFDSIIGIISQGLSAFGTHTNTQITPTNGVSAIASTIPQQQQVIYQPATTGTGVTSVNSAGSALGSGLDGIFNWALANPLYIFLGLGGYFLLTREPPRSRR